MMKDQRPHRLDINTLDYCQHKRLYCRLKGETIHKSDVDCGTNPETMRSNYLDIYEGVYAEVVCTKRCLFQEKVTLWGKLLDGTECQMLLNTGASKSYMSTSYF